MFNYTLEENLEKIEYIKTFIGDDNEDVPVFPKAIEDITYIVNKCKELDIPQPFITPWAGGNGVQAEWEYDYYLEIDSCDKGVSALIVKGREYNTAISCKFRYDDINGALTLISDYIKNIVNIKGKRN